MSMYLYLTVQYFVILNKTVSQAIRAISFPGL